MRFMFIIKTASPGAPPPELVKAMHEMAEREVKAGRMIADGGLMPKAAGKEIQLKRGKLTVLDGPFAETKEQIGGFAIFELPDEAAAVASAQSFLKLHQDLMPGWEATCEVRQIAGSSVERIRAGS